MFTDDTVVMANEGELQRAVIEWASACREKERCKSTQERVKQWILQKE